MADKSISVPIRSITSRGNIYILKSDLLLWFETESTKALGDNGRDIEANFLDDLADDLKKVQ